MAGGKRLTYYIEKQGITKKDFCNKNGFDYASFTQVLSETRSMGIIIIDKIHIALPKLNIHWLLYGEGTEEIEDNFIILNETSENYNSENDFFERVLLKYLGNEKIKTKIKQILKENGEQ